MNSSFASHPAQPLDTDVLLVGLGPVGAALANLLGRYGVRVLAIDKSTAIFEKPRAIALDNEALRILQMVGVRDGEFATVAIPQVQYHSPLFGRFARINSAGIVDGHPSLVTFHQPELEQVLREKLAQHESVEVRLGVELESFLDDGHHVHARLRRRRRREPCRCAHATWSAPTARARWCGARSGWTSTATASSRTG